jgi:hypothetical protein
MLNVITVSVIMLNVIMVRDVLLNLIMQNAIMLNAIMRNAIMLNVIMLDVIVLSVVMLDVIMLNVVLLSLIMLNAIMLDSGCRYAEYRGSAPESAFPRFFDRNIFTTHLMFPETNWMVPRLYTKWRVHQGAESAHGTSQTV